jgi:lactate dehydrogenase-like 2-hydroxyacid dehydrogenase
MAKPRVVLTRRWPDAVERELQAHFEVELNDGDVPMSADELRAALTRADALFPTVTDKITAEVLGVEGRTARLIGNYGVGFNNIDIEAAKAHGIVVTNTPDVLTDTTADLAMALMLAIARRVGEGERHVRGGHWTGWRPTHMQGTQVTGKTLGLVGLGRIGRAMAKKAHHGFEMPILGFDPYPPSDEICRADGITLVDDLATIFKESDFVSIHCPATPENRHLVNAERLAMMPSHAYLINTARGDIVDEAALLEALRNDRIRGAGLDVFEREPALTEGLAELDNAVLLPHLGSATRETREAMGMRVLANAIAFFKGEEPGDRVA